MMVKLSAMQPVMVKLSAMQLVMCYLVNLIEVWRDLDGGGHEQFL